MQAPALRVDDRVLVEGWERASARPSPWREVELLAAITGSEAAALARLSLGDRDRLLLHALRAVAGDTLACETTCPACQSTLEFEIRVAALITDRPPEPGNDARLDVGDCELTLRLLDTHDLAHSIAASGDIAQDLFERSIVSARRGGDALPVSALGADARRAVAARLEEMDAQMDVALDVACQECAHRWRAPLDPGLLLLREVERSAQRSIEEVHVLAREYGWREADILAMPRSRRWRYLELVLQ